jgi:predicted permease
LSYDLWRAALRSDPAVVGRSITLNNDPYRVVGIMPRGFQLIDSQSDLWTPLTMDRDEFTWAGATGLAFGRLRDGATIATASAEMTTLAATMRAEFEHPTDWSRGAGVMSLRQRLVGGVTTMLWLLFGAVAFLLVIAATNVANLLLVRTVERRQELALRASLGASSGRLVRLLILEALIVGLAGGAVGIALAYLGVDLLRWILPSDLPRLHEIAVNGRVLLAAAVGTIATAFAFGVAPAWHGAAAGIATTVRSGGASRSGDRTRSTLVSIEVALALILLAGATLMSRSLIALTRVDPGLAAERLLTAKVQPSIGEAERLAPFWSEALARIEAVPGVVSAGTILHLPMSGRSWMADIEVEGRPVPPGSTPPRAAWQSVSRGYFATARVPLIRGRSFEPGDRAGAPRVVLVNTVFAARMFPGENPVGRRIRGGNATSKEMATIVGIVGAVRHDSLNALPGPEIYLPFEQRPVFATGLLVRTTGDPVALAEIIRARIWSLDPNAPVTEMRSMESVLFGSLERPRLILTLIGLFAAIGLALGAVGIYGVVAFGVRQRLRELGIRAALGADRGSLTRLVVRRGLRAAAGGLAIGLPLAVMLSVGFRRFQFAVAPTDPASFAVVTGFVLLVALAASWIPARRAARADPALVLKE